MPTTEVAAQELKCAVESKLGGTATFVESVPISASRGGVAVWKGAVHIFDLVNGLCGVSRAYAWSDSLPDGQRRSVAVLHIPPIVGPREAVKVTMLADEISN